MANTFLKLSSVSKKIFMGAAGLFLIVFLVVHLGINLTLLRNDDGEWFMAAAGFMSGNYIVKAFEIVLFGSFFLHILIGVILKIENWLARPIRYHVLGKSQTSFFSRYMIWTGLAIGVMLFIHFINFYFVKMGLVAVPEGAVDKHDFYSMAINLFQNPLYCWIYIIWLLVLGLHLYHAFQSVFQTFGLSHNKYNLLIKNLGLVYAVVISAGFMVIPVYFQFFYPR